MSFSVNPDELAAAASNLSRLVGDLASISDGIRSVDAAAAGHPRLVGALTDFASNWSQELEVLHLALADLQTRLSTGQQVYTDADSKVRKAFSG